MVESGDNRPFKLRLLNHTRQTDYCKTWNGREILGNNMNNINQQTKHTVANQISSLRYR